MRRFRLTNTAKAFSALVVAGVVSLTFYCNPGLLRKVAPSASSTQHSNVPTVGALLNMQAKIELALRSDCRTLHLFGGAVGKIEVEKRSER